MRTQRAGAPARLRHGVQFAGAARSRLFDQHVLAGGRGLGRDRRQLIVRGGRHHDIHVRACDGVAPVRESAAPGARQGLGASGTTSQQTASTGSQRAGALRANQAAADDRYAHKSRCYTWLIKNPDSEPPMSARPYITLDSARLQRSGLHGRTISKTIEYFTAPDYRYQIIVAADGTDGTRELVAELGRA